MLKYCFILLLLQWTLTVVAQNNTIINGIVADKSSGEVLVGASVRLLNRTEGVITNNYGHFSISVSGRQFKLIISHIGFSTDTVSLDYAKSLKIELSPSSTTLQEVKVISDVATIGNFRQLKIPIKMVEKLPAFLGETDILKNIQMLPGVQMGTEGTSGFHVRGGSPDQNLILLDGVPVYNVNHLFGFFSTFNTDAIANVDFYKNIIPSRFGGRLSSVVDIKMKEGNNKVSAIDFSLSPIAGRLLFESPLIKEKASLMVSYRRTWLDLPMSILLNSTSSGSTVSYFFDDFNAKANFQVSSKDQLFISYYTGYDDFKLKSQYSGHKSNNKYGFDWGNQTASLRWNHTFSPQLFANTQIGYSEFKYHLLQSFQSAVGTELVNYSNQVNSGIKDVFFKSEFDLLLNEMHQTSFGFNVVKHLFSPETKQIKSLNPVEQTSTATTPFIEASELGLYMEDNIKITNRLDLTVGFRNDIFWVDESTFLSFQPRVSLSSKIGSSSRLNIGYGQTSQFTHLVINSSLSLPTDLWVPSTAMIKPEKASLFAIGFEKKINSKGLMVTVDSYYKSMTGLVEYKEGSPPMNDNSVSWQDRITTGKGISYGLEFMLQKNVGKVQGWASYTLAWANRTFDELNTGKTFPYKYDRRHNFSAVITYDFSHNSKHKRTLSANFVLTSGLAVSFAANNFTSLAPNGLELQVEDLSSRNNFRTPTYHRIDVSYQTTRFKKHGNSRTWSLGFFNVYNHANANLLYAEDGKVKQISLLPIMPSVSYQRSF